MIPRPISHFVNQVLTIDSRGGVSEHRHGTWWMVVVMRWLMRMCSVMMVMMMCWVSDQTRMRQRI